MNIDFTVITYTANLSWIIILTYQSTFYAKLTRIVSKDIFVNDNAKLNIHNILMFKYNILVTVSFQNNQLLYFMHISILIFNGKISEEE